MTWDDCVEQAKIELGVYGYVDKQQWDDVIDLAKKKFWASNEWYSIKRELIQEHEACQLCGSSEKLTGHHIIYGSHQLLLCVCKECHDKIHEVQKTYGFVVQCLLLAYIEEIKIPPNLFDICCKVAKKLDLEIDLSMV